MRWKLVTREQCGVKQKEDIDIYMDQVSLWNRVYNIE